MFNFIRRHQRLMQLVLLILILPSFVLIGVSGYTNYVSGDEDLVSVGDSAVTAQEFDQARRNQLHELQRSMGNAFDPAVVETPEVKQQLLDSLVDRRVLIEIATKERFSVSDTALRQAIAAMPEMQEDGVFSPQRYNQLLAGAGLTSKQFEQSQRAELALARVITPVTQTAVLPQVIQDELQKVLLDSRTIQMHVLQAADKVAEQSITDEEIQEWYQANQEQLRLPDYVNVDYVLLDEQAAVKSVPALKDEDLQSYYEQNKARFVTPARIHLSHILIQPGATDNAHQEAQKQAKDLAAQAQAAPDQFAELAKAHSQDKGSATSGGELGWITQGNWPEVLQNAVFALKKGEVSGVIEGPDGYHIFKANDFQEEQRQPFEAVREQITNEARQQLAAERFADMATKLTDLVYESPESLAAAAETLGLPILQAKGVARDRLLSEAELGLSKQPSASAALLEDPRVRRALYTPTSLEQKQNAGVIELSSDTLVAVRVNEFVPSHVPSLEQLRTQVEQTLAQEKALEATQKAGQQLLKQLQAGEDIAVDFSESLTVSRIDNQQLPKATLDRIMTTDVQSLPAYVGVETETGYQLVKIIAKESATPDPLIADFLQMQLQQLWGNAQEQVFMQALRDQLQVKTLPAAATAMESELEE
ncbi:SurA N-terminal domain-containing protein [Paenalcaligenes sp.]|uniref:SurA N-terminal domain-containing protein n=1 Tax=Paenalcaligenes sp. TaxID=1966342 RepID=UPI0026326D44|nr:SurA N-terminal domain-containing protein [Paenalcaligenes sp.]